MNYFTKLLFKISAFFFDWGQKREINSIQEKIADEVDKLIYEEISKSIKGEKK